MAWIRAWTDHTNHSWPMTILPSPDNTGSRVGERPLTVLTVGGQAAVGQASRTWLVRSGRRTWRRGPGQRRWRGPAGVGTAVQDGVALLIADARAVAKRSAADGGDAACGDVLVESVVAGLLGGGEPAGSHGRLLVRGCQWPPGVMRW